MLAVRFVVDLLLTLNLYLRVCLLCGVLLYGWILRVRALAVYWWALLYSFSLPTWLFVLIGFVIWLLVAWVVIYWLDSVGLLAGACLAFVCVPVVGIVEVAWLLCYAGLV